MTSWLRRLIHHLLGASRYHDQANDVQVRELRLHTLERRYQVLTRPRR